MSGCTMGKAAMLAICRLMVEPNHCIVDTAVVAGGVAGPGRVGGQDGAAAGKIEIDIRLEANGEAEVGAFREDERASTSCGYRFNGLVDGRRVHGFSIAGGAEGADVEDRFSGVRVGLGIGEGDVAYGGGEGERRNLEEIATFHDEESITGGGQSPDFRGCPRSLALGDRGYRRVFIAGPLSADRGAMPCS